MNIFKLSKENIDVSFVNRNYFININPFVDGLSMDRKQGVLRRMLPVGVDFESVNTNITNEYIFSVAALITSGFTPLQLKYLGLSTESGIKVCLSRSDNFNSDKLKDCSFYFLNKARRTSFIDELRFGLFGDNMIECSWLFDLPSKLNYTDATAIHTISSNDLWYFLAGFMEFPQFTYEREFELVPGGFNGSSPVRSDAMFRYVRSLDKVSSYVEVDTGTQGKAVIVNKLNKYIDNAFGKLLPDELMCTNLNFAMVSTKSPTFKNSFNYSSAQSERYYLTIADILADTYKVSTVGELVERIEKGLKNDEYIGRRWAPSDILGLVRLLSAYSADEYVDAIGSISEKTNKSYETAIALKNYKDSHVLNRSRLIKSVVQGEQKVIDLLKKGLSIVLLPLHDLYSVFPYVYLAETPMLATVLGSRYSTCNTVISGGMRFFFRLKCGEYYIENISHDIGGYERASFYSRLAPEKNKILLIVKDVFDAAEFIFKHKDCRNILDTEFLTYEDLYGLYNAESVDRGIFRFKDFNFISGSNIITGYIDLSIGGVA